MLEGKLPYGMQLIVRDVIYSKLGQIEGEIATMRRSIMQAQWVFIYLYIYFYIKHHKHQMLIQTVKKIYKKVL